MTYKEIREQLRNFTVGIAGAGGLGSNCAVALARSGIGKLIIVDFDIVEEGNLNRQYYFYDQIGELKVDALNDNLKRIDAEVEVEVHAVKLNEENIVDLFSECDVVVEAFDRADMKAMIIETVLSEMEDIKIVSGLGMAGYGNNNIIKSRQVDSLYICGDEKSEVSDANPPLAPRVAIVAGMQANTVLEILLRERI